MATKKRPKMDRLLVSQQTWELDYIAGKFSCSRQNVRDAIKAVGRSRRKVYNYIREHFLKIEG